MRLLRILPLAIRMIALVLLAVAAATALTAVLVAWLPPWLAALSSTLATGTLMGIVVWRTFVPLRALIRLGFAGNKSIRRGCGSRIGTTARHDSIS